MSRPVQNHLDSYKMYNQILQFSDKYLYHLKKYSQNFHPPPQKVLQTHFQVVLSDLSLDAPGRPWTPLCQNVICLTSPGAGACHPPPPLYCQKSGTPWYVPLIWTQINCKVHFFKLPESYNLHFYNYQHCTHDFDL